jgi:hypothetical protein
MYHNKANPCMYHNQNTTTELNTLFAKEVIATRQDKGEEKKKMVPILIITTKEIRQDKGKIKK